jgi:hypothetical protein
VSVPFDWYAYDPPMIPQRKPEVAERPDHSLVWAAIAISALITLAAWF